MKRNIAVVMAAILVIVGLVLMPKDQRQEASVQFSAVGWKDGDAKQRGKMVRRLLESHVLPRMSESAVLEMLGEPDRQTNHVWEYTVDTGEKFGSSPWKYRLVIKFDEVGAKDVQLLD